MAQQTYIQLFNAVSTNFIGSVMITPIVSYYDQHPDEAVTREKLLEILNLPAPSTPTRSVSQRNLGAVTQPLTTNAPKRTRTTRPQTDRPQCKWVYTKGDNVGKQCQGYATDDSEYCSACKNKKGAGGSGRKVTTGGPVVTTKGTKGTKSGFTANAKSSSDKETESGDYEIAVDTFGESTDGFTLLRDENSGFILKDLGGSNYTVVGFCSDAATCEMRELTPEEREHAKKLLDLEIEDGVTLAQ